MKISRHPVTVSATLLTLALFIPLPAALRNAWTLFFQGSLEGVGGTGVENYYELIGFASVAIITIGLIATWTGYIKGCRWTWFVMFLITWGWAFPVLVLSGFHWRDMLPMAQWPPLTPNVEGPQLTFTGGALTWLIMVVGVLVPAKTFLVGRGVGANEPPTKPWDHTFRSGWQMRLSLKTHGAASLVSSALLTLALLMLTPTVLRNARTTGQVRYGDVAAHPEAGIALDQVVIPNYFAPLGITSLAIVGIGLVVTWAGYVRGVRWTWFVMLVIAWLWAFPLSLLLPFLYRHGLAEFLRAFGITLGYALHGGPYSVNARESVRQALAFLLMVVALVLPAKAFIVGRWDDHHVGSQ